MVDLTHELGKEAMMFLGDHWIGMEPFLDEFKNVGLDAVVGKMLYNELHLYADCPQYIYEDGAL